MRKQLLMITPENKEINSFRRKQFNNFIQLTMPYLAGFVDESKYEITLIDEYNQKIPFNRRFDLVAITINTPNALHCYDIADKFRSGGSKVVFGGPHATLLPDEARKYCDYILIGEGENTWPRFLDEFYYGIAKACYICEDVPTLMQLPNPRRDLIKRRMFTKGAVIATRGCPYNCAYCNLKQIYCNVYRTRPINEVLQEIATIKSKYFVFWDDNFWGDMDFAKELMIRLKQLNKRWAAQVTLDRCADEEVLHIAKESGCIYLFLGIESFSSQGLDSVNKGFNDVSQYEDIIKKIHSTGISIQAGIIFGLDTDKKDIFQRTLETCENLGIDGATVSILTPFPKTPVYERMKSEGRLKDVDWSHFNGKTRVAFKPTNMTEEELFDGYMWFRRNFYSFRSIFKRLKISKTNTLYSLVTNLGYKFSI